ncbi:hypothetical protein FSP39_013171 [Pinctada imbricata]|uniref:Uncharacterized protein n=1 Tax=Pinctada imbricata TaxID=66713 RepID=A0AA88XST6_PINIB|nr:hypothetical protein FSP39_013171 [Pinctada imbricata]
MSELKELRRLKDEERALMNIASKLSDQLNRLKVEELALLNMIKMKEGKEAAATEKSANTGDDEEVEWEGEENVKMVSLCVLTSIIIYGVSLTSLYNSLLNWSFGLDVAGCALALAAAILMIINSCLIP